MQREATFKRCMPPCLSLPVYSKPPRNAQEWTGVRMSELLPKRSRDYDPLVTFVSQLEFTIFNQGWSKFRLVDVHAMDAKSRLSFFKSFQKGMC